MRKSLLGLAFAGLLLAAAPMFAHHSFSAEFDASKPVTLKGFVTKIDWTNPHVWIYMNVKDEKGVTKNWGFEMGPPHLLQGQGWSSKSLKIGDEIEVDGSMAKNGSNRMNARSVKFAATGVNLGAGSSQGINN